MKYLWLKVQYWIAENCWTGDFAQQQDVLEDIEYDMKHIRFERKNR